MSVELELKNFAGQHCDVVISERVDGSFYIQFKSAPHYGFPCLEEEELLTLLTHIRTLKKGKVYVQKRKHRTG